MKAYVEPTNACNLSCSTCVRHAWDEPEGFMEWATFEAIVDGVASRAGDGGEGEAAHAAGTAFRESVRAFDFPPCTDCGCELAETNEEDCLGNQHPVCGDCLWARGIIRCA